MPWDHIDEAVLAHWRALGSFRARHVALAHGVHARLATAPYVFSRIDGDDRVVVALGVPAGATLPLGAVFADGQTVRDAYAGTRYVVHGGALTVAAASRIVLLERTGR